MECRGKDVGSFVRKDVMAVVKQVVLNDTDDSFRLHHALAYDGRFVEAIYLDT